LQKCASKSYFNLLKCSGPWSETLKTVNNVTMMINNKLAVLSFTLHHVERITKKKKILWHLFLTGRINFS